MAEESKFETSENIEKPYSFEALNLADIKLNKVQDTGDFMKKAKVDMDGQIYHLDITQKSHTEDGEIETDFDCRLSLDKKFVKLSMGWVPEEDHYSTYVYIGRSHDEELRGAGMKLYLKGLMYIQHLADIYEKPFLHNLSFAADMPHDKWHTVFDPVINEGGYVQDKEDKLKWVKSYLPSNKK